MIRPSCNRKTRGIGCKRLLLAAVIPVLCAAACGAQPEAAPDNQRQQALVLEQQGRNDDAEAAWRSYLKTYPSNSEAYAHLGLLEARQQHYDEAVPLYRKALALHSTIPGLRLNLGLAYFKAGKMNEALQQFNPLLEAAPASSPDGQRLTILVGMCHYGLGQYARAAPYLKQASSRDPRNLELLLALAHSYLWSRQYRAVMDVYHEILAINAESAEADMLAGEALDELKDSSGAVEQFHAAARANPKLPDVHFGLGYLLWTQRKYSEAAPEFKAELENDPDHAQALTYLGDTDMQLGAADIAIPLLKKAIQIDPKIELAFLDLGAMDADAGRLDEALQQLQTAAKLAPGDVNVHWRLGRLYRAMGNGEQAKAELAKAKTLTVATDDALIDKMNPKRQSNSAADSAAR